MAGGRISSEGVGDGSSSSVDTKISSLLTKRGFLELGTGRTEEHEGVRVFSASNTSSKSSEQRRTSGSRFGGVNFFAGMIFMSELELHEVAPSVFSSGTSDEVEESFDLPLETTGAVRISKPATS